MLLSWRINSDVSWPGVWHWTIFSLWWSHKTNINFCLDKITLPCFSSYFTDDYNLVHWFVSFIAVCIYTGVVWVCISKPWLSNLWTNHVNSLIWTVFSDNSRISPQYSDVFVHVYTSVWFISFYLCKKNRSDVVSLWAEDIRQQTGQTFSVWRTTVMFSSWSINKGQQQRIACFAAY